MISNCGHDESWGYTGGRAGDQTAQEWEVTNWYSRPWNCVLRHPDAKVRALHASMAKAAALNDHIGYDQGQRDTFGAALKAAGDDPAAIRVDCETDCSKGVIDITKAIGRKLGLSALQNIQATYTGNMRSAYRAAGYTVLTESKYLTSAAYLLAGDILLNDVHHVATNLDNGNMALPLATSTVAASGTLSKVEKYTGVIAGAPAGKAAVRTWAGPSFPTCSFSPLADGAQVGVCSELTGTDKNKWLYIRVTVKGAPLYGFVPAAYVASKAAGQLSAGDKVTVTGTLYDIANGSGASEYVRNEKMYITEVLGSSYRYPIGVSFWKDGERIGWTARANVKQA